MAESVTEKPEEVYRQEREEYFKTHGIEPYPHQFVIDTSFREYIKAYQDLESGARDETHLHRLAGRVREARAHGNLYFYTVDADGLTVQYFVSKKDFTNQEKFHEINKAIGRGDHVGIIGFPAKTKKGELSVIARELVLLAPCMKFLPKQAYGLTDRETRARRRYLDLIVNPDSRTVFVKRSEVFKQIRMFLWAREFIEVQTPVLSLQAGGASAKPFVTHHNDLDQQMFLRIAPELYLKQCIIGGLHKVFEMGPQFRNECIDWSHLPEFNSIEWYWAYADYMDNMKLVEELFAHLTMHLYGKLQLEYQPHGAEHPVTIDFTPPFKRVDIVPALEAKTGLTFPADLGTVEAGEFLDQLCHDHNIDCSAPRTNARLLDKLIGHFLESECVNPTFLINHPLIMCPLAKWHRNNPNLSERFELFVCGMELANAYTELNDPNVQRSHFEKQMQAKAQGDDEAQPIDEEFIGSLEYGLPPTSGCGIGVDRLAMLMTLQTTIRDVTLFPAMAKIQQ